MSKRWITFDLDGTLMQNPFGAWVFPEIADAVSGMLKRPYDMTSELVAEHERRMEQGRFVEAYDWDDMLARQLEQLGVKESFEIEPLVRKHSVPPKVRLLEPSIPETLKAIRSRGFALAAVTNGFYKFQAPVMEVLGLLELFDEVVTPERAGTGKPDPAIFHTLPGEICAHVGDRIDHDIQLANRSNAISVLINRTLSIELKSLQPWLRSKDKRVVRNCLEKWRKESGYTDQCELPKVLMPAIVIDSITELLLVIDIWQKQA